MNRLCISLILSFSQICTYISSSRTTAKPRQTKSNNEDGKHTGEFESLCPNL